MDCLSLNCAIPADPDGLCWKHKLEMLRDMGLLRNVATSTPDPLFSGKGWSDDYGLEVAL